MTPKLRFPEFTKGWKKTTLGEIAVFHDSDRIPLESSERKKRKGIYPYYGASGIIDYVDDYLFNGEYILLAEDGANIINRSTPIAFLADGKFWVNNHAHILKATIKQSFVVHLLENQRYDKYNTGTAQPKLNRKVCESISLCLPDSDLEIDSISSLLDCIDQKINLLTKKKEALETYKKGLMQKIFSQELRFKREDGTDYPAWHGTMLEQLINEIKIKSESNNQHPILTSSRKGLFFQSDYYSKQIASEDNTGYNVVPRGCFTYRHMSDDLVFKFNINNLCDFGLVSTLYPVFKVIPDKISAEFLLLKLNEGQEFKRYCLMLKQGGSRTYMYLNTLKKLKLVLPSIQEQYHIIKVAKAIDKKVECCNQSLQSIEKLKKGLLQQMFV